MTQEHQYREAQGLIAKLALAGQEIRRELTQPLPKWPLALMVPLSVTAGLCLLSRIGVPREPSPVFWVLLTLCLFGLLACIDAALRHQRQRIEALSSLVFEPTTACDRRGHG